MPSAFSFFTREIVGNVLSLDNKNNKLFFVLYCSRLFVLLQVENE